MTDSKEVALPDDMETGLEEFDQSDAVVPRLQIVHKDAEFKDSLSGMLFNPIKVIFLGLVKQRVLWHFKVGSNEVPMCKSNDFQNGYPRYDDEIPREKRFPWDKSGFNPDDFDLESTVKLPCKGCKLKEWETHPDGHKPYCVEQWTIPSLYDPFDNGKWVPIVISFQRTQLRPLKGYTSGFMRSEEPLFTAITEITLRGAKTGSNEYAIPSFVNIGRTERDDWIGFSTTFSQIKKFLRQSPSRDDAEQPEPSDNTAHAPSDDKSSDEPVEAEVVGSDEGPQKAEEKEELPF
jgi:hypothetical protein